jgi:hypothetical protein
MTSRESDLVEMRAKDSKVIVMLLAAAASLALAAPLAAQSIFEDLAGRKEGRSMRASSTFRKGKDGRHDPRAEPLGDGSEASNHDNGGILPPGATQVVLDVEGPGAITHMWFTFVGPEGHFLGIESVLLRERRPRVERYGRDRDRDWRKEPILYTKW